MAKPKVFMSRFIVEVEGFVFKYLLIGQAEGASVMLLELQPDVV